LRYGKSPCSSTPRLRTRPGCNPDRIWGALGSSPLICQLILGHPGPAAPRCGGGQDRALSSGLPAGRPSPRARRGWGAFGAPGFLRPRDARGSALRVTVACPGRRRSRGPPQLPRHCPAGTIRPHYCTERASDADPKGGVRRRRRLAGRSAVAASATHPGRGGRYFLLAQRLGRPS
jgi:hypothetical protein